MYSNFYSPIYAAMKKSKKTMYSALGGAVVNIILNFLLIPELGIMGACIATSASYIFIAVFRMIDIQRILNLDIDWKRFICSILIYSIVTFTTVYKIDGQIPFIPLIGIILIILIYWKQLIDIIKMVFCRILKKRINN